MKKLRSVFLALMLVLSLSFVHAQNTADNITGAYFNLKNALATANSASAQSSAKALLTDLSSPVQFNPEQQKIFNSYAEKLRFDARHISESTDIEHQREHFESLSKNWFEVLKGLKMNKATVYEDYCPMKKAYWLSETQTIKNPYYNDKMMATCGKVAVTLPAAK